MKLICPLCRARPIDVAEDYYASYVCDACGPSSFEEAHDYNNAVRVVWLRSNRESYTAEIQQRHLLPKGVIRERPDLAGFVWEPWP